MDMPDPESPLDPLGSGQDQQWSEPPPPAMEKIKDYMIANHLALNGDKMKIMIMTKNRATRDDFKIEIDEKIIKHSSRMKVLGTVIGDNLMFDKHLASELIPNLKNHLRTLRMTTRYMSPDKKYIY